MSGVFGFHFACMDDTAETRRLRLVLECGHLLPPLW